MIDDQKKAKKRIWSRRRFVQTTSIGAISLCLPGCSRKEKPRPSTLLGDIDPLRNYPYRTWEDFYRKVWTWDKVVRSTHSANCTGSCSWKVFVRNGVMVREEQAADYPRINNELPDYNPRGCQKGGCFVEYVYGPQRLRYPLIRTGARGEGKWRRASWDEALGHIAEKLLDNIYNHGPDTNTFFSVIPAMSPVSFSAGSRLAHYLGGVFLSFYDWYCDLPPGEPLTWGVQTEACECADWFNSKYIVLWGSNISQTRIPDAHFAYEARYNGARIVCISPDYNSSAIHADLYLRINPGTDTALALGVARILIDESLTDLPYVKEQTDLPLLVVKETRRFLRESDMKTGGKEDLFYCWDAKRNMAVQVPGSMGSDEKHLRLGEIDPLLGGSHNVRLADGRSVEVTTTFELLRSQLADYGLERTADLTGLPAHEIQAFARELGRRKPAMIIHGAGTNHWFHNDLANRAFILLVALTGNIGKNGGGFNHYVGQERVWPEQGFIKLAFPEGRKKQRFQNTTLWSYAHSASKDPHLYNGKSIDWYIQESVRNGWMPLWLKDGRKPRAMIVWRANYLNQAKGNEVLESSLWRDLDLIVDINYRMDTTALYSDVVLPAASYYEKVDINSTDCHSYIHPFGKALDPLFESRTDWDLFHALAAKIGTVAKSKGLKPFRDESFQWDRDFTTLEEDWTGKGKLVTDEQAADYILSNAKETQGMTYRSIQDRPRRFIATDEESWNSDVEPGVAYTPFKHQVYRKKPWRTLTGRQQFYIDHPWYIELGETLPVHKEPVPEKYPLLWNTPHGRWSIHSTWRDHRAMLRLQRGLPIIYMNPMDARNRGLSDNDWVRIFNDIGQCICRLQILPGEKEGRVTMYHGWEKFLGFQQGGWQSLTYIKIKPTQLIGKYGHINFRLNYWGPTGNNRDIRVQVEKAKV